VVTPPDPVALALILARILERLGIRYCIGGSVASSVYGEVRTTLDVDVVADLYPEHIDALGSDLGTLTGGRFPTCPLPDFSNGVPAHAILSKPREDQGPHRDSAGQQ